MRASGVLGELLLIILATLPVAASAGRPILIESYAGSRPPEAAGYVEQLLAALDGEDAPLHGAPLRQEIESRISRGPGHPHRAEKLRASVEEGGRLFIEGEFGAAIAKLEASRLQLIQEVAALATDQSLRNALHRALLFLAHAYLRSKLGEKATERIGEVIRSFPDRDLSLVQVQYGPELVTLYRQVRSQLSRKGRGTLVVNTQPPGCLVFIDERFVGVSPARVVDLYPGRYRVYVQAHQTPGRVHRVTVDKGENVVQLHFDLDRVLLSEPYVGFRFPDLAALDREETALASELGQALDASSVLLLGLRQHQGRKALVGTAISPITGRLRSAVVMVEPTPPSPATLKALGRFLQSSHHGDSDRGDSDRKDGIIPIIPDNGSARGDTAFFSARVWKWVTLGLAAGSLAAGVTLLALNGRGTCDGASRCPEMYDTALPGGLLTGLGTLSAGGSGFLFYWDHRQHSRRAGGVALLPWFANGAGLSAVLTY